jgi:glycosyltransferase involved in cell wall biosynthesis
MQQKMEEFLISGKRTRSIKSVVIPDFRPEPRLVSEGTMASFVELLPPAPFILFVGALRRIKGIEVLLEAYAALPGRPPPLVLIGSKAPDTPKIGSGITVLHDWPFFAVLEAWRRCLFGVSPSVLPEPLGNVVHEGMSQGKAVIGTMPGGHGSMITDGVTGLLVPSGNVGLLRDAMMKLISDNELREELGSKARERAGEFTGEVCLPRFNRFYDDTVGRPWVESFGGDEG